MDPSPDLFDLVTWYAGKSVTLSDGFSYVVRNDGSFLVTGAPAPLANAVGMVITATGRLRSTWFMLARTVALANAVR